MVAKWLRIPPWELAERPGAWIALGLAAMRIETTQPIRTTEPAPDWRH